MHPPNEPVQSNERLQVIRNRQGKLRAPPAGAIVRAFVARKYMMHENASGSTGFRKSIEIPSSHKRIDRCRCVFRHHADVVHFSFPEENNSSFELPI
jgi:hypothetical protein